MDKLSGVDWGGMLKTVTNKVKKYTLNLTELELKVEDATSNETWGASGSTMNEIAEAAFDFESYRQIMGVLARRLQEKDENWRMCYKALLLLEHLVKNGPMKVVQDIAGSAQVLDRLTNFEYRDPNGKDFGVNVRHRAKELLALVNNPDRVREERQKAKANRAKYVGVSATEMRGGGFGGGGGFRGGGSSFTSAGSGTAFGGAAPTTQRAFGGGGGGLGGDSFGRSSGGGALGGAPSFGRGGRVSQEDAEEDYHYISKRATASEGGEAGDAVAATRARIDALKLSSSHRSEAEERAAEEEQQRRKKLTDVKVNPKIAASLGLKFAPAAPPAAAPAPAVAPAAPVANQVNLMGGLTDPTPAAATAAAPATDFFDALSAPAPAAAPVPAAAAGGWDAFAAPAAAPPAASPSAAADGWDAFGASAAAPAPPVAPAAAPLDFFRSLDSTPALAAAVSPAAAAAPAAFDPFVIPAATSPAAAAAAAAADPFAAPPAAPAAAPAPAAPAPPATSPPHPARGPSRGALPEDMFSDLTGLNKPVAPMGSGRGLHMEPPPLASGAAAGGVPGAFPAAAAPGGGMPGVMGAAGGAPRGPVVVDPRTGQPVMLVPVPLAPGQQPGGMPGMGMPPAQPGGGFLPLGQPDLSSLMGPPSSSGSGASFSAAQGSSNSGKRDPFADLLG